MTRFRWPATVAAVVALAGCSACGARTTFAAPSLKPASESGSPAGAARSPSSVSSPATPVVTRHGSLVTWAGVAAPSVTVTSAGVYLAWRTSPPGVAAARSDLARVDTADGKTEALIGLDGRVDSAALAAGSLWVATTDQHDDLAVSRLDPHTLRLLWTTPIGAAQGAGLGSMAVAGGYVWIAAAGRLARLALPGGQVSATVTLAGAASSNVTADAAGDVLVVSVADDGGRGHLESRNPDSGALLAQTAPVLGLYAPLLEGVVDHQLWVSWPTGMHGSLQRYTLSPLRLAGPMCVSGLDTSACFPGSNGIGAIVADGRIWESQLDGGPTRNRCLDPTDHRSLAPLPLAGGERLLAVGPHLLYVGTPSGAESSVSQRPIPPACRQPQAASASMSRS